ncbi:MAG: hypothetical protein MUP67_10370 [Acidimicrobiia bacterium]|nr:hypothetical protein [Acidimicrobiia bacterium]
MSSVHSPGAQAAADHRRLSGRGCFELIAGAERVAGRQSEERADRPVEGGGRKALVLGHQQ